MSTSRILKKAAPGKVPARIFLAAIALGIFGAIGSADARIKRSQTAKVEFKASHPCPANGATKGPCKGYVIDHVKALACGGPDAPSNMQWQDAASAKAKDKWERKECGR